MKKRKKIEDAAPEESSAGSAGDEGSGGNEEHDVSEGNEGIQATEVNGAPDAATPPDGERITNPYMEVPSFDEKEEDTKVGDPPIDEAAPAAAGAIDGAEDDGEPRAAHHADEWEGPTQEGSQEELAALAAESTTIVDHPPLPDEAAEGDAAAAPADPDAPPPPELGVAGAGRLEAVIESLLFASDHPLTVNELKKLVGERDGAKITAAVTALQTARQETGINVISVAGGWHLRTNPTNVAWVSRLIAGKPQRLSRAMLETLAIVAYRQPITRPEVDDIRGVDCGPVLKTLLDRGLVRMIGKKEDVGRPILYGTTPEFLRTFSLRDLTELPTLREFHELGADEQAEVDAKAPRAEGEAAAPAGGTAAQEPLRPAAAPRRELDPEEDDELLSELERAAAAAAAASAQSAPAPEGEQPPPAPTDAPTGDTAAAPPPRSDG
jgi:segregation and condensation protein B